MTCDAPKVIRPGAFCGFFVCIHPVWTFAFCDRFVSRSASMCSFFPQLGQLMQWMYLSPWAQTRAHLFNANNNQYVLSALPLYPGYAPLILQPIKRAVFVQQNRPAPGEPNIKSVNHDTKTKPNSIKMTSVSMRQLGQLCVKHCNVTEEEVATFTRWQRTKRIADCSSVVPELRTYWRPRFASLDQKRTVLESYHAWFAQHQPQGERTDQYGPEEEIKNPKCLAPKLSNDLRMADPCEGKEEALKNPHTSSKRKRIRCQAVKCQRLIQDSVSGVMKEQIHYVLVPELVRTFVEQPKLFEAQKKKLLERISAPPLPTVSDNDRNFRKVFEQFSQGASVCIHPSLQYPILFSHPSLQECKATIRQ